MSSLYFRKAKAESRERELEQHQALKKEYAQKQLDWDQRLTKAITEVDEVRGRLDSFKDQKSRLEDELIRLESSYDTMLDNLESKVCNSHYSPPKQPNVFNIYAWLFTAAILFAVFELILIYFLQVNATRFLIIRVRYEFLLTDDGSHTSTGIRQTSLYNIIFNRVLDLLDGGDYGVTL